MNKRVYLAGPAVFFRDVAERRALLEGKCREQGLDPVWPADDIAFASLGLSGRDLAKAICTQNVCSIMASAAVVADISPFRGPHCDPGTAFEIGVAAVKAIPVFAFTDAVARDGGALRLFDRIWCELGSSGEWRDVHGHMVEDFDMAENLMIGASVRMVCTSAEAAIARAAEWLNSQMPTEAQVPA